MNNTPTLPLTELFSEKPQIAKGKHSDKSNTPNKFFIKKTFPKLNYSPIKE
jgi:hypothetical protein